MSQRSAGAVRILAVFHTHEDRESLGQLFRGFQWEAEFVVNTAGLGNTVHHFRPDVVLTDSSLPEGECWKDVLRFAQETSDKLPVIVSSRLADERLWAEVLNLGGYDLLVKPFIATEVRNVVSMACRARRNQPVASLIQRAAG
jgi:DNA-binding response OmpR family regulator